jgi:hypothetical protein
MKFLFLECFSQVHKANEGDKFKISVWTNILEATPLKDFVKGRGIKLVVFVHIDFSVKINC